MSLLSGWLSHLCQPKIPFIGGSQTESFTLVYLAWPLIFIQPQVSLFLSSASYVADSVDIQLQPLMSSNLLAMVVSLSATSETAFVRLPFVH